MFKKFPFYKQHDMMDCGPSCLRMIAEHYGRRFPIDYLRKISYINRDGVTVGGISDAAEEIGLHSMAVSVNFDTLSKEAPLPCIAHWRQRHFVVVFDVTDNSVSVADPAHGIIKYRHDEFLKGWLGKGAEADGDGVLILFEPTPKFLGSDPIPDKSSMGLKFVAPYFRLYRQYIIQLVVGLFVGSLLQLAFPFLTQSIVDYGIRYQNLNFIYLILAGQIMLFLSQASLSVIRNWLLLHLGARINISIAADFLHKLMRLPVSFFDSKMTGDILQRIEDNRRIENFLSSQSLSLIFSAVNAIVFLLVLFYYHYVIGLVFLGGSLLYSLWIMLFSKQRAELEYRRFDESAGNSSSLLQIISGFTEIKLNGSEKRRRWEWEAIQIKLFKISIKSLTLGNYQGIGATVINELKNIFITFLSAKSVLDGQITLGMMLAIQYIIGQLNTPLNSLIGFVQSAQDATIGLKRISEVYGNPDEDNPEEQYADALPENKDITISNLSFRYGGPSSAIILNQMNLTIPAGKVTAIVGPSGSGKTTLLRLLIKLYAPTGGRIEVGRIDLKSFNSSFWRKNCGVVMQDGFIFTDTLLRNITESDSEHDLNREKLRMAVRIANIAEFAETLPLGYNTRIGPSGSSGVNLSGGQRQRVLIARAVYKNPEFLYFDEATSSLDANNERYIMEELEKYFEGRTVLIIAHRLSTVKKADQIVVMEHGQIVERGTHQELTEKRGAYYNLVKNQLELGN